MATVHVYKKGPMLTRDMFHNANNTVSKYQKPVSKILPVLNKVGNFNNSGKVGTNVAKRFQENLERKKMGPHVFNNAKPVVM